MNIEAPPVLSRLRRITALALTLCVAAAIAVPPVQAEADYEQSLKPLFRDRCFSCHGAMNQKGGLRLDTVAFMRKGGESGSALAPGDPEKTVLWERVTSRDETELMPPKHEAEPLNREQLRLLKEWIAAGAPAPKAEKPEADPREHWAFRPRTRPPVPQVGSGAEVRNPVDAFLAHAREQAGIVPQGEAPRHVLVRRLFVDLIGLPPQPGEIAQIEADTGDDWYERLVERLLADPRHGERWARHWMDVWRYADWWGLGNELRNSAKHIWRFRDWIVESLNADTGYDEMVRLMLAADETHPEDPAKLRATGFLARNWNLFSRTFWLDETVEHVGKGLLGLTLNCSKCHAHKYDPISQQDYYRMRAFFEPYHVRVDVVPGESDLEKDGLPRVFDGQPDTPTYLYVRGNEATPDKSKAISPGVPALLAFTGLEVRPVSLPKSAFQPERRPWVFDAHIATARREVEAAEAEFSKARARETAARAALAASLAASDKGAQPGPSTTEPAPAIGGFVDGFTTLDESRWRVYGGSWHHTAGRLVQEVRTQVRSAVRLLPTPPRDFDATVTFTITGGSTYRSVGLSFDASQENPASPHRAGDNRVSVYASAWAGGPKVQGSFLNNGVWQYPAAAAAKSAVESNRKHTLRVAVRDTLVNAWLDGEPVIAWRSPLPRRPGNLQITTFDAAAVFEGVCIAPLVESVALREPVAPPGPPSTAPETARAALIAAERGTALAAGTLTVARASLESISHRAAATRVAWETEVAPSVPEQAVRRKEAALQAARSERELALERARLRVVGLEGALAAAASDKKAAAEKALMEGRAAVEKAAKAASETSETFTPLVGGRWVQTKFDRAKNDPPVPFLPTSTGRRTALASWIADARNPLTARVAANHIWMRHMGRPLVSTVFDFGRKGNAPRHPELLDWLASELVEGPRGGSGGGGWSMKHLHRLIVTSAAYRMSSSAAGDGAAAKSDPDNLLLWRREPVRLDAEVIRDALLSLSDKLDPTMGGPSVEAAARDSSTRRSLYLYHSGVSRSTFLATFDAADAVACYQRDQSIVPQQALALSNAALAQEAAAAIASRIAGELPPGADDEAFVVRAFFTALGRAPDGFERSECLRAIRQLRELPDGKPVGRAADPARIQVVAALLNHNDFVTLR